MEYLRRDPSGKADTISTFGKSLPARSSMLRTSSGDDIMVDFNGASRLYIDQQGPIVGLSAESAQGPGSLESIGHELRRVPALIAGWISMGFSPAVMLWGASPHWTVKVC